MWASLLTVWRSVGGAASLIDELFVRTDDTSPRLALAHRDPISARGGFDWLRVQTARDGDLVSRVDKRLDVEVQPGPRLRLSWRLELPRHADIVRTIEERLHDTHEPDSFVKAFLPMVSCREGCSSDYRTSARWSVSIRGDTALVVIGENRGYRATAAKSMLLGVWGPPRAGSLAPEELGRVDLGVKASRGLVLQPLQIVPTAQDDTAIEFRGMLSLDDIAVRVHASGAAGSAAETSRRIRDFATQEGFATDWAARCARGLLPVAWAWAAMSLARTRLREEPRLAVALRSAWCLACGVTLASLIVTLAFALPQQDPWAGRTTVALGFMFYVLVLAWIWPSTLGEGLGRRRRHPKLAASVAVAIALLSAVPVTFIAADVRQWPGGALLRLGAALVLTVEAVIATNLWLRGRRGGSLAVVGASMLLMASAVIFELYMAEGPLAFLVRIGLPLVAAIAAGMTLVGLARRVLPAFDSSRFVVRTLQTLFASAALLPLRVFVDTRGDFGVPVALKPGDVEVVGYYLATLMPWVLIAVIATYLHPARQAVVDSPRVIIVLLAALGFFTAGDVVGFMPLSWGMGVILAAVVLARPDGHAWSLERSQLNRLVRAALEVCDGRRAVTALRRSRFAQLGRGDCTWEEYRSAVRMLHDDVENTVHRTADEIDVDSTLVGRHLWASVRVPSGGRPPYTGLRCRP